MKWRKYGCNVETAARVLLPSAKRTWLRSCTGHQILRAQQSAARSLSRPTLKPLIALSTFLAELLMTPAGVSICWANTGGPCIPGPDARTTGRLGSDGQEAVPAPFPSPAPILYRAGGPWEQKGPLFFRGAFWQSAPRALRTFIWSSLERRGPNEITWAAMLRWLWKRSFSVLLLVPLSQISVEIQGSCFFSFRWRGNKFLTLRPRLGRTREQYSRPPRLRARWAGQTAISLTPAEGDHLASSMGASGKVSPSWIQQMSCIVTSQNAPHLLIFLFFFF